MSFRFADMPGIGASIMLMIVFWMISKTIPALGWVALVLVLAYLMIRVIQQYNDTYPGGESNAAFAAGTSTKPLPRQSPERKRRTNRLRPDQARVADYLNEQVIGQHALCERISIDLEAHFLRKPRRPFSLLVTGQPGTGRAALADGLAQAMAQTAGDALLADSIRIQCTVDTYPDIGQLTSRLKAHPGRVLHLADIEHHFHGGFEMNSQIHALVSMLGSRTLSQNIIVLTSALESASLTEKLTPETRYDGRVSDLVQTALAQHLGPELFNALGLVSATRSLTDQEKCLVVWQLLNNTVNEFGLVLEDPVSPQDRERCMALMHTGAQIWSSAPHHGRSAVTQWLARKATDELVRAKKAGKTSVFARWQADVEELTLV